ncbi:MAG: copper resistance protein [Candidatus Rokuibacteriota bacterium]|nr:MAG: copper resistance protein [Candidatus Rokubacteria bacterium]
MTAFVDVILRGLGLSGQAIAVGGVVFALLVLGPTPPASAWPTAWRRLWTLVAIAAIGVAVAQAASLGVLVAALGEDASPSHGELATTLAATLYARASVVRMLAAVGLAAVALIARRRERLGLWWLAILAPALVVGVSGAWTSHSAARLQYRGVLVALDAVHQLAAAAWIGGLVHLVAAAFPRPGDQRPVTFLRRFSSVALVSVAALVVAGVGLSLVYVDGISAAFGTAYGIMIMTKALMLAGLLVLGFANFRSVRSLPDAVSPLRLRRFVEVELGLGLTVFFAAASLSSLPPAVDVVTDRATFGEVATRFTPRWPALTSPSIEELPVDDPTAPRTDADRAWSEYNHHINGLFVLLMGVLAVLHATGRAGWARHWPLVFLGMAAFMLVRNDPGAWPIGPQGFWASMAEPTVLQHRLFMLLVVLFGIFEWMVRTGRLRSSSAALVFPMLCAVGGGLLLTHSHASLNLKSEFLLEVTHTPLGVLGILIGWARWLELRLPGADARVAGRVWASALAVFGVLLLLYRES